MDSLIDREKFEKDKVSLAVAKYLLSSAFFYPFGFILWYLSNKGKVSRYSALAAILVVSGISAASYIYVLKPLASRQINLNFYWSIIYGGIIASIFFLSRFTYPACASVLYWISYYVGYMIFIMSTIFWAVIPRYYLAHRLEEGSLLLVTLGILWLIISILINHYNSPIKEGIAVVKHLDRNMALFFMWLLALCACSLLWLILYASQRLS